MDYTYTVILADPARKYLSVVYQAEGRDDFTKIFMPIDWSEERLRGLIEEYSSEVLRHWLYQEEEADTKCPIPVDVPQSASNEPMPVDYIHDHLAPPTLSERRKSLRDALLRHTDYLALTDSPEMPVEVADYRQALRDVPNQPEFPNKIVWPAWPSEQLGELPHYLRH
jgi:hypothetical protein